MCDPVTAAIAVGVTTVASTAANVVATARSAKAQERAVREQLAVTREETRQEASAELFDQMRAARRERGRIRAAAGEAGLSLASGSIESLLMDSAMQAELARDRTLANMESRQRANLAEAQSMMSQIQKPTAFGAGLQLAAAGAQAWSGVQGAKIAKANASRQAASGGA